MDYDALRHFADSWGLLFMVVVFVGLVLFVFRKGAKSRYDEYGKIPLKDD
jgi:cytochrome c oxidase cbb3-type subunit 4